MDQTFSERLFDRTPDELRKELRDTSNQVMFLRRSIIVCGVAAILIMAVVSLFQTGVISHLPDLPFRLFDSDKVNSSNQAFRFGLPDGTLVLVSLSVTIALAAFGSADRAQAQPWLPLLFSAKAGVDAAFVGMYFWNMVSVQKVACIYCIASGLLILGIFFLSLPEAWRGLQYWGALRTR